MTFFNILYERLKFQRHRKNRVTPRNRLQTGFKTFLGAKSPNRESVKRQFFRVECKNFKQVENFKESVGLKRLTRALHSGIM